MQDKMFQPILAQMKASAQERVLGVMSGRGEVVASTDYSLIGHVWDRAVTALDERGGSVQMMEYTFKSLQPSSLRHDYAVFVEGEDQTAFSICGIAAVALNCARDFYEEKHNRSTFIKNLLLENILPGDIYARSRELNLDGHQSRVVLLLRQKGQFDNSVLEVLKNLFPDRSRDFVILLSENEIVLVKEVDENTDSTALNKLAVSIEETVKSELMLDCVIGIGTVCTQIRELSVVYREAQTAIEVGKVFDAEKRIVTYENLGIGRLIYQLPTRMCSMFLNEAFKKDDIETLDIETLNTISGFFENNLNVSETSRRLFVHRNTLVYRIEKIKRSIGLDIRCFEHAVVFKVALMVKKYLKSCDDEK
ncbi:MAG: helix-turn-helix domain-containing protein [Oscillospiraceae bacterium]|nr:helix-turn-helix domain-containing protein [Oscillospiraceae bacterium]